MNDKVKILIIGAIYGLAAGIAIGKAKAYSEMRKALEDEKRSFEFCQLIAREIAKAKAEYDAKQEQEKKDKTDV